VGLRFRLSFLGLHLGLDKNKHYFDLYVYLPSNKTKGKFSFLTVADAGAIWETPDDPKLAWTPKSIKFDLL
jgi:hypothetical protein